MAPKKQVEDVNYQDIIDALVERVARLEEKVFKPVAKSINQVETFNGEVESPIESYTGLKMNYDEQLFSMLNAIKILPPNLIVDGRHARSNVEALVGFKVSDEMMDDVYAKFSHED